MLTLLSTPENWIALATLTLLEIVLGVDNIIFLSILVDRLPPHKQTRARIVGLSLAMLTRLALLFCVVVLTRLTAPLFTLVGRPLSIRGLVLALGGLFLLSKSVFEVHRTLEAAAVRGHRAVAFSSFIAVVIEIALIDVVFSLDSVFTAVGLARPDQFPIMAAAIVIAVLVMMWLSGPIAAFVSRHPTMKMLALSFLILIGMALVAEAVGFDVPKGYLYFAMGFSFAVELINIRLRRSLDDSG